MEAQSISLIVPDQTLPLSFALLDLELECKNRIAVMDCRVSLACVSVMRIIMSAAAMPNSSYSSIAQLQLPPPILLGLCCS